MHRQKGIAAFVIGVVLCWAAPAAAQDPIAYWNLQALAAPPMSPPLGRGGTPATIIDVATVHLAMHDAVQAYAKRYEPYAGSISGASGSVSVAVAKAAYDVLLNRFPNQKTTFDTAYATFLASLSPAPSQVDIDAGEDFGSQAANNVITKRMGDGSFPAVFEPFFGGSAPGQWQAEVATGMASPWGGNVRPFALDSLARCAVDGPPALHSFQYTLNYIEVKLLGSATSSFRTPEQSAIARMFSGNFPGQYNRLLRDIAAGPFAGADLVSLAKRGRLFALTNMAMSDAFICAWNAKTHFNFWRPNQAIRRGNEDGNILTIADPMWTTYFSRNFSAPQNPPYPDYTSGANNVTGATTRMLELILGSDQFLFNIHALGSAVPIEAGDPNPRVYERFSDLANDVVNARIYLGIHFRFADVAGRSQGRRAAQYAFEHELEPVRNDGDHHDGDRDR
jgi:hypothetical protein